MIIDQKKDEFEKFTYTKQNNYEGVSEFKRILNYYIDDKFRETVIDKISSNFEVNYNSSLFYVSEDQLLEMSKDGNIIGSHTMDHYLMSKLTKEEQHYQIQKSFQYIDSLGCLTEKTYCHPYGGNISFNQDTIDILNLENVLYSFSVESRLIVENDILNFKQCLPRFDCNEFKHGLAS